MPCPNTETCPRACRYLRYCTKIQFLSIEPHELAHPEIVRAARFTLHQATSAQKVKPLGCRNWLYDLLWKMHVDIVDRTGRGAIPNMDHFEATDDDIGNGRANDFDDRLRDFFRSNACRPVNGGRVFVTQRWHRHFATMATIVGANRPNEAQWWPRIINGKYVDPKAANDNHPPKTQRR